jgi:hypothetical protein
MRSYFSTCMKRNRLDDEDTKTRKIFTITIIGVILFGVLAFVGVAIVEELKIEDVERLYGSWTSEFNTLTFFKNGTCKIYNYSGAYAISTGRLFINYTGVTLTSLTYTYSFSEDYHTLTLVGSGSWDARVYIKQ